MQRDYTATEKLAEIERELKMRRDVYRRKVEIGHMAPHTAAAQIEIMEAIRDDYERLAAKERLL